MSSVWGALRRFDYPALGLFDHFNDVGQDFVASVIKLAEDLLLNLTVSKSNLPSLNAGLQTPNSERPYADTPTRFSQRALIWTNGL
jgi:hypothetical protein